MSRQNNNRIRLLSGLVILASLILLGRLYTVQVVHGDDFRSQATAQYTRPTNHIFNRGSISFTGKDGTVRMAATQESGFVLAVNARILKNPTIAYKQLSDFIDISQTEFLSVVKDHEDPYVVIEKRLNKETAEEIDALNIEGVGTYTQKWRRYPNGSLAAHILGYVGYGQDGISRTGLYGVEQQRDDTLSRDNSGPYVNFFAQAFAKIGDTVGVQAATPEGHVSLTIEPDVQAYLEGLLADTSEAWGAEQVMGVVINPNTGAVRAMAANPTFNPNNYSQFDTSVFTNPIVQSRFEMGSIIKPLTVAAGLDAGVITPDTTYNDRGTITLNGSTITNYDGVGRGVVDMQAVLNQSLNTGAAHISQQLGQEAMRNYFYGYGFNEKTGIDLPSEITSDTENLNVNRDLEYATASFGQGIALTPIATVRALSTLANGGQLITPHVTKSIDYTAGGDKKEIKTEVGERVLKEDTSEEISRMLAIVADEALLGGRYSRDRHSIALKTGTAQIAKDDGGYYDNLYNHTYFGYFPAYDPRFLVFLMARRPQGARYASQTLTEPFFKMTDFLINYYNIPPDR